MGMSPFDALINDAILNNAIRVKATEINNGYDVSFNLQVRWFRSWITIWSITVPQTDGPNKAS